MNVKAIVASRPESGVSNSGALFAGLACDLEFPVIEIFLHRVGENFPSVFHVPKSPVSSGRFRATFRAEQQGEAAVLAAHGADVAGLGGRSGLENLIPV